MIVGLLTAIIAAVPIGLPVGEVVQLISKLDGQLVDVSGVMGECSADSCDLYEQRSDAVLMNRRISQHLLLGFRSSESVGFGTRARLFTGKDVVVRGVVHAACARQAKIENCAFRVNQLTPMFIDSPGEHLLERYPIPRPSIH